MSKTQSQTGRRIIVTKLSILQSKSILLKTTHTLIIGNQIYLELPMIGQGLHLHALTSRTSVDLTYYMEHVRLSIPSYES